MRQTHKDNFLKYSQRHLGFECGQKDGTQLCVLCVCGGGVMGLLFCNLLLDPRGSWIATPDYLGAGASTRKVIPWRQIESLSSLSLFLKFLHPVSLAFYLFSQSLPLRHVDTHFLPLLHKHTALLSKPPLFLQHPCFTLPLPPPAILSHVALPSRPFSPPLFHFSFIILFKRHSGLMKTALIIHWHNSAVFSFSPLLHEMGWTGVRDLCLRKSFPACFICETQPISSRKAVHCRAVTSSVLFTLRRIKFHFPSDSICRSYEAPPQTSRSRSVLKPQCAERFLCVRRSEWRLVRMAPSCVAAATIAFR